MTKERISKRALQQKKARQHFRETNISYPLSFLGKFGVLCFAVTSILKFALLPYHQQYCCKESVKAHNGSRFYSIFTAQK